MDNTEAEKEVFATLVSKAELEIPKLPAWNDAPAVTSYIVAVAGILLSYLTVLHIGVSAATPHLVQEWAGPAGLVVAAVAQAVNLITHRVGHVKAFVGAQFALRRLHDVAQGN